MRASCLRTFSLTCCLLLTACAPRGPGVLEASDLGVGATIGAGTASARPIGTRPPTLSTPRTLAPAVSVESPTPITLGPETVPSKDLTRSPNLQAGSANPEVCSPLAGLPRSWLPEIISQPYSAARNGRDDGHPGLDLAFYHWRGHQDIRDWPVQAVLAGRVSLVAEDRPPFGNLVLVESAIEEIPTFLLPRFEPGNGQSVYILYAHLAEPSPLSPGDRLACGDPLGRVGNTGFSGAPHLHLEGRLGPAGAALAPLAYYDTRTTPEEREAYRRWRMSGEFEAFDPLPLLIIVTER